MPTHSTEYSETIMKISGINSICSLLCLGALVLACKGESTPECGLRFAEGAEKTEVSSEGGSVTVGVEWEYCKWKISADPSGKSAVQEISPVYGGTAGSEGVSTVSVVVLPNDSKSAREIRLRLEDTEGRLADEVTLVQNGVKPVSIKVDKTKTYQTIDGFGAMNSWGDTKYWTKAECDLLFGTLGLDIMRLRIPLDENSWGNILESAGYAAQTYGAKLLASPWTMPAEWKNTGAKEGKAGETRSSLLEEHYEDYALYLERYAGYMAAGGAALYAISIQNEPDWPASYEGCCWTPEQTAAFASGYAHLIRSAKVTSGEPMGSNSAYWSAILDDEKASANVDILAGHLYGTGAMKSYPRAAGEGKPLWMTEHLLNDSWNDGTSHWDETMTMADEVSDCLTNGWSAYIWWYGRRYYSFIGDGEKGSVEGTILPRGHAFGQFSRYIDAGDVRIAASASSDALRVSAFSSPDGRTAVVIVNDSSSPVDASISLGAAVSQVEASFSSESEGSAAMQVGSVGGELTFTLRARSVSSISYQ